jgi:hypothetical protein
MGKLHWQGALDGLCGLYSVINATEYLCSSNGVKLKTEDTQKLFRALCDLLSEEGRLQDVLVDGMRFRNLGRLIDTASSYLEEHKSCALTRKTAFAQEPKSLSEFWNKIAQHIEKNNEGSVILLIGGKYNHWTCVKKISDKQIFLYDSADLSHFRRKNCTIGAKRKGRVNILYPTQSYLLSFENKK